MNELRESCTRTGRDDPSALVLRDDADAFAWLAGRPTSLRQLVERSRALRAEGERACWEVPLRPDLVYRLEALFSLARDEEALAVLLADGPDALDPDARRFAWDFVRYRLLEEEAGGLPAGRVAQYRALERRLAGADADALPEPLRSGAFGAQAADVARVLRDGARGALQWALACATSPRPRSTGATAPGVVLIGAYGGDHIGDAAILGGVLRRLHAHHRTERAVLLSQRPAHSRHLAAMLDVPVALSVDAYEHAPLRAALARADALVYAGGPITDIPKQLVRHLYAASLARRQGKPFWVEGVGVGPFQRRPSEWVARRLIALADRVSVRTSDDARQPQVAARAPEIGRDPAFDYLESRVAATRVPEADRAWLARLLAGSEGRPKIGLNVRPIHALFTAAPAGADRASHTRSVEARFEEELAEGMRRFHAAADPKPCFVFFPMNAIQFGLSDLRSAWRIARRLGGEVDFRVWEGDASIDGVVCLLRELDAVIAMRFHAVIYALSQQRPVIGIDYRPGRKDKVGYLLDDFGRADCCTRIDQLEAGWLCERLRALCAAGGSA